MTQERIAEEFDRMQMQMTALREQLTMLQTTVHDLSAAIAAMQKFIGIRQPDGWPDDSTNIVQELDKLRR